MARVIKDNKDVFQSYVFTVAKYDLSVYEKRIMYRLVEMAQSELKGIQLRNHLFKITPKIGGKNIQMPVSFILKDEEDKNYEVAKRAFLSLATKGVEYEDEKTWSFTNIITNPRIDKGKAVARFDVCDDIWKCIINFTKGYRKYELKTTMNFRSVYSMRFYELLSGQKTPLSFTLYDLKEMFKMNEYTDQKGKYHPEKYKLVHDFEEKVLDVAQKELNEYSPYSFTYEEITVPSRGRKGYKVTGYRLYPCYIPKNRDVELEVREIQAKAGNISGRFGILSKNVTDYLLFNLNVPKESINSNKSVFLHAQELFPNLVDVLAEIGPRMRDKARPVGYLINALKAKIKEEGKEES